MAWSSQVDPEDGNRGGDLFLGGGVHWPPVPTLLDSVQTLEGTATWPGVGDGLGNQCGVVLVGPGSSRPAGRWSHSRAAMAAAQSMSAMRV